jgi:hypothetical protein
VRQLIEEVDVIGGFRRPEPGSHERTDIVGVDVDPGHQERRNPLAPLNVRYADYGCFSDAGMLVEDGLDLRRRDVLAAADDRVIRAAANEEESVFVEVSFIARAEPSLFVEESFRALVLAGDLGPSHVDQADRAWRCELAPWEPDLNLDRRQWPPHRPEPCPYRRICTGQCLAMVIWTEGCD